MKKHPRVSIVIPVRNEEEFISKCLDSLLSLDYPKDKMEILVVDGMSTDNTRDIVRNYTNNEHSIKVLDNPFYFTPYGLNIGIKNSTGDVIMVAGAHTLYSKNYIKACVNALSKGYDIAGGIVETLPRNNSPIALAIASVLSHPLGVGKAVYRTLKDGNGKEIIEVDTVAYGLYKKSLFDNYGLFNESLTRNQDIELNLRMKRNGAKIGLVTNARAYYYARDSLKKLWKNNFANGFWVIWSTKFAKLPFSFRHLVPLFFVLYVILVGILSLFLKPLLLIYLFPLLLYIFLILTASIKIGYLYKSFPVFLYSFLSFLVLHFSYGLGSLYAIFRHLSTLVHHSN